MMNRTGGEIVVDYLISEGVEAVAGIPGHGCLALFDALRDREARGLIRYIPVLQEMDAVYLADGYYRATGKPLAVFTSIGPGALNTMIGLATAFVDSTPVLVVMGDTHTHMRGVGVLQEVERRQDSDILSCFKPVTKRCWRPENVGQLPKIMARAFNAMLTGRRGPVALALPMDIQAQAWEGDLPVPLTRRAQAPVLAQEEDIARALGLMAAAKRPVIVAGGGALHARATEPLTRLAEAWGAAVVTTMAGKSVFPEDHPLYAWHGGSKGTDVGNALCRTADVVLAVGCRFADETTSSYRRGVTYSFPDTKLIHVDIDPGEIGKNYPVDVGLVGDACAVLGQLLAKLPAGIGGDGAYRAEIARLRRAWLDKLSGSPAMTCGELTISLFLKEMQARYPAEGYIVTSSGNTQAQVLQEYCFRVPGRHITTGGFSTMGFAMPAAIGVMLAHPEAPVAALVGDGDALMALQELALLAQRQVDMLVVVLNNCGWLAIRDLQLDVYGPGHDYASCFTGTGGKPYTPDFAALARGFGIEAWSVSEAAALPAALERAIAVRGPRLLEVRVARQYPISGGSATGWWDVPVPAYLAPLRRAYLDGVAEEAVH